MDPSVPRTSLTVLLRVPACPSCVLLKNPELSPPVMSISRVLLQPPPVPEIVLVLATSLLAMGMALRSMVEMPIVLLLSAMLAWVHR